MTRNIVLITSLLIAVALTSGCSSEPTTPTVAEPEFGAAARNTMQRQIYDIGAAMQPSPEPLEGSDPDRLNNALNAYRESVAEPKRDQPPINLVLGN
jgi:hypothetical protein